MSDRAHRPQSFVDPKVLARLAGIGLHARTPMLGNVSGRHRSPIRGSSLEFAEYRKYVAGDDPRRLDWRAWGRSNRFYIKEFEADTNLRLCLIVDTSGSLNYAASGASKLDLARSLAGTLAYLAANQGDAVGLYGAGTDFHTVIRPRRNAAHLRVILDHIAALKATGGTGLAETLHQAAESIGQRALVVILSDLFLDPEELGRCFQHLRFRKHDVAVFHLLDQSEIDFRFDRPTRFVDLEGGAAVLTDPLLVGRQYREAMRRYLADLTALVREAAVDYHRVNLGDAVGEVLSRFLIGRRPKLKK